MQSCSSDLALTRTFRESGKVSAKACTWTPATSMGVDCPADSIARPHAKGHRVG